MEDLVSVSEFIATLVSDEDLLGKVKKIGGITSAFALLSVSYYYFHLPFYNIIPTSWLPVFNLWLLFSGMSALYLICQRGSPRIKVLKSCPKCGKDLEIIINPELKCPTCGILKFENDWR